MDESIPVRIGDEATTASVLRPGGMVVIRGQRYSARSGGEMIDEGTPVIVTGGDNHGFAVRAAAEISDRESLPAFGRAVYADFGSSNAPRPSKKNAKCRNGSKPAGNGRSERVCGPEAFSQPWWLDCCGSLCSRRYPSVMPRGLQPVWSQRGRWLVVCCSGRWMDFSATLTSCYTAFPGLAFV